MCKTRGRIYHRDLEIKFEEAAKCQGVLQCEVINVERKIISKHWNKNAERVREQARQHYFKIQDAHSFSDESTQLGVLMGTIKTMLSNCSDTYLFVVSFLEFLPELMFVLHYRSGMISRCLMRCTSIIPLSTCQYLSMRAVNMTSDPYDHQ